MGDVSGSYAAWIEAADRRARRGQRRLLHGRRPTCASRRERRARRSRRTSRSGLRDPAARALPCKRYFTNRPNGSRSVLRQRAGAGRTTISTASTGGCRRATAVRRATATLLFFPKAELDMLQAEGLIRKGQFAGGGGARSTSRASRTDCRRSRRSTTRRRFRAATNCVPKVPVGTDRQHGRLRQHVEAMKWEKRMETAYTCSSRRGTSTAAAGAICRRTRRCSGRFRIRICKRAATRLADLTEPGSGLATRRTRWPRRARTAGSRCRACCCVGLLRIAAVSSRGGLLHAAAHPRTVSRARNGDRRWISPMLVVSRSAARWVRRSRRSKGDCVEQDGSEYVVAVTAVHFLRGGEQVWQRREGSHQVGIRVVALRASVFTRSVAWQPTGSCVAVVGVRGGACVSDDNRSSVRRYANCPTRSRIPCARLRLRARAASNLQGVPSFMRRILQLSNCALPRASRVRANPNGGQHGRTSRRRASGSSTRCRTRRRLRTRFPVRGHRREQRAVPDHVPQQPADVGGVRPPSGDPVQGRSAGSRHFRIFLDDTLQAIASTVLKDSTVTLEASHNYTFLLWGNARRRPTRCG